MKRLFLAGALCGTLLQGLAADDLERGFANPPVSTKPWCYWYWISDNISREGITKDLEAMKRAGIGEAFIGNIYLEEVKAGAEKALSESWWGMVAHAVQEGGRIGVNVGLFNCPGWSQSGGPWIKPEQAMRYVASSEHRVHGPKHLEAALSKPNEQFQDLCVLAFPAPVGEMDLLAQRNPVVSSVPQTAEAGLAFDGSTETVFTFPADAGQGGKPYVIEVEVAEPFMARSLVLRPAPVNFTAQCELAVADKAGEFRVVRSFSVDRSNNGVNVGFVPHAPVSVTFPAVTSRKFRLSFTQVRGAVGLAEVEISAGARVERYIEKQLAKMHPTPLPMWDAYLWPATAAVGGEGLAVKPGQVHDLTSNLQPDGRLVWDAPPGDWIVLRLGLVPTGTKNAPASPEGQGLEVDKMNRSAAQAHFDAFIGNLLTRVP
ncbi:MAG TPA: glycosyl hydrolase, partial [Clostridia bacterium]|nr:glycosyl hydrolase [Clostridia bacterium]